ALVFVTVVATLALITVVAGVVYVRQREQLFALETRAKQEAEARERNEKALREEAEKAQAEADRLKQRAEANFLLARQALGDLLTRISESKLLNVAGLQLVRRDLLESTLKYYKESLARHADDPAVQKDLAMAYERVGRITAEIGSKAEAL